MCIRDRDLERDIRAIATEDPAPSEEAYAQGFQAYNNKEMISLKHGENQVLLSVYGMVQENVYMDPRNAQMVTVDPIGQEITAAEPMDESMLGAQADLRAGLDQAVQQYCTDSFAEGAASAVYPDLTVCISSSIYAPNKAWSGRWQSVYKFENGHLSGTVDVSIHYYEFGNTMKTTSFNVPAREVPADPQEIVDAIRNSDLEYHKMCTQDAVELKQQFTSLRRQLPITKAKLDWAKLQNECKVKGELAGLL
eukprot:TRINITY_DN10685_c0_g2_i4.p1 TRINITY_DN10685_c0_g2~~TRINITY_DN10685_c0_g2_i4.p1  ORF type:complete len:251 (+),score=75.09 TRINITY_DN10685_c0_g2_i4:158-910(+)